jgi:hypothetical protein
MVVKKQEDGQSLMEEKAFGHYRCRLIRGLPSPQSRFSGWRRRFGRPWALKESLNQRSLDVVLALLVGCALAFFR